MEPLYCFCYFFVKDRKYYYYLQFLHCSAFTMIYYFSVYLPILQASTILSLLFLPSEIIIIHSDNLLLRQSKLRLTSSPWAQAIFPTVPLKCWTWAMCHHKRPIKKKINVYVWDKTCSYYFPMPGSFHLT